MMIQYSAGEVPDRSQRRPDPWIDPPPPAARRLASSSWRIRRRSSADRLRRAAAAAEAKVRAQLTELEQVRAVRQRAKERLDARVAKLAGATRACSALTIVPWSWTARLRATSRRPSTSWSALIT